MISINGLALLEIPFEDYPVLAWMGWYTGMRLVAIKFFFFKKSKELLPLTSK